MIYYLGMMGMAVFAITGVIAAGRKEMDIFSIILFGVVTAMGGGTLRDIILDSNPIFWIGDLNYLWVSVGASIAAFGLVKYFNKVYNLLLFADALGIALFTILAAEKTMHLGFSPTVAVLMGVTTGAAGGVLRDILTGRMPLILGREFYATPMLIGAVAFTLLEANFAHHGINRICGMAIIFILRAAAVQWGLYYPEWLRYRRNADDGEE